MTDAHIIWNSTLGKAMGRMTVTSPLGWVDEQFAYLFVDADAANLAASAYNLDRFEVIPVTALAV